MALDWLVRVQLPAWQLALQIIRTEQSDTSLTLQVPKPIPEITAVDQLPSVERTLYSELTKFGWGIRPSDNWACNYHESDPGQAAKNNFRKIVWQQCTAVIDSAGYGPAMSAAYVSLSGSDLDKLISWSQQLVLADAAEAASTKLWPALWRDLEGLTRACDRATWRARGHEKASYGLWHTEAPCAWEQREYRAWLACIAVFATSHIKAVGWDFAAIVARKSAIAEAKDRAGWSPAALNPMREMLQKSAFVLVNNMIELSA